MRTFVITKSGIARIMQCRDDTDGAACVAKWHPDDQAQVTNIREISPDEIPADRDAFLRDAWEDDGTKIAVNVEKAKAAFEKHLDRERLAQAALLQRREMAGEDVSAERTALQAMKPDVRGLKTVAEIKAAWPLSPSRR